MLSVWGGGRQRNYSLEKFLVMVVPSLLISTNRVAAKLKGKQDRSYFLHDNATPHLAKSTHQKLLSLGWITIPHPAYSPDLASTDYHLYRSLSNYLREKKFNDESQISSTSLTKRLKTFTKVGFFLYQSVGNRYGAYILHWELCSCIRKKKK